MVTVLERSKTHARNNIEEVLQEVHCGWEKPCSDYNLKVYPYPCGPREIVDCPQVIRFENHLREYLKGKRDTTRSLGVSTSYANT